MSVVKTVGAGVVWNTSAVIIGKGIIFVNVLLILTFLSVYEYGFSELVASIISTIGIMMLPGLTSTIVADMSVERGRDDLSQMKRIFHQFFFLNLALGTLAWAVLFFGSQPVAEWAGNPYAAQFLQIASFIFLVAPLRQVSQVLAATMLRFFDLSFYSVFEEVTKCVLLLVLVVWLQMGLHGLMFSMVLSQAIVMVLYLPRTISAYRHFSEATSEGGAQFWNIVRGHRKWSVASSYVGTLSSNARIWIIKLMLGTEAVGLFAFAYGIFSHVASLMPLTSVMAPVIPQYIDKRDQLIRIVRAAMKAQFLLGFAFMAVMCATAHVFVVFFFPKYLAAIPLIYILAVGLISNSIVALFTPVFAAFKEQGSLLLSNIFKAILIVCILPPAILLFGVSGTAVEVVLTTLGNAFERYARFKRILPEFTLPIMSVFHPDPYEKEAMHAVRSAVRARVPGIWPLTKI